MDWSFEMNPNSERQQILRTLSVLRQLSIGKQLTLKDGHRIGMAEDMTIGFVLTDGSGGEHISRLSELNIRQLNEICEENEIDYLIPDLEVVA